MRRVVVTGIGMCTPLGFGWKHCWNKLIEGKSGIRQLSGFEISDLQRINDEALFERASMKAERVFSGASAFPPRCAKKIGGSWILFSASTY